MDQAMTYRRVIHALWVTLLMLASSSLAEEQLWKKSFANVTTFNLSNKTKNVTFEKDSAKGKSLMEFLSKLTAAGPRLPLGELADTSDDATYFLIRGNDHENNTLLAISIVELKKKLIVTRILKVPEDAYKLKDFLYVFDVKKWPGELLDLNR